MSEQLKTKTLEQDAFNHRENHLTLAQAKSLRWIKEALESDKRVDADGNEESNWHFFFENGVRDSEGGVYFLSNNLFEENTPSGWMVFHSPSESDDFSCVEVSGVINSRIPTTRDGEVVATTQVHLTDKPGNVLNILHGPEGRPLGVRFTYDSYPMEPIPDYSNEELANRAATAVVLGEVALADQGISDSLQRVA